MLAPGSGCAVRNYAIRSPWLDRRDIDQEAALAAVEAAQTWRADGGASRDWYEARIVALALSKLVREAISPVSLPDASKVAWQAASASRRAPLTVPSDDGGEYDHPDLAAVAAEQFEPLEDLLDRERAMAEIRRILAEQTEAARLVLLAEEKSAEVARRMGVSIAEVYADTKAAVRALRLAFGVEVEAI